MLKIGSKFENVDVIGVLQKIMEHNTESYQADFNYDVKVFERAAADSKGGCSFLWLSRLNGTWCFSARDVYINNTHANHTWQFYSGLESEMVKAFWVELNGAKDDVITGNIVELDYEKHVEYIRKYSLSANAVEIVFKHPNSVRTFDIKEYEGNHWSIANRYGAMDRKEYKVSDEYALNYMIDETRNYCFQNGKPDNIDAYIEKMVWKHFHDYGYTKGDMAFTTAQDAQNALRRGVPVYALNRDGSKTAITQQSELMKHYQSGGIFGINQEMKAFFDYLIDNHNNKALFTNHELDLLRRCVVFAGEGNEALTSGELKYLESLMYKLDIVTDQPVVLPTQFAQEYENENDMEV